MQTTKVTRLEIISENGREYVNMNCELEDLSYQDDGKTLKVFIKNVKYKQ